MDVNCVNPFLEAIELVLGELDKKDIKKNCIKLKDEMYIDKEITAFLGIVGEIKGNVSYSFDFETAKKIVSRMMMGMPVKELEELERSALAELANMITGNAVSRLKGFRDLDITPPSVIMGEDIFFIIGSISTLMINIETAVGTIEVNFGLES